MSIEAVAKSIASRQVDLREWSKVILEEILFRAAQAVPERGDAGAPATLTLNFSVTADRDSACLLISMKGAIEGAIVTRLPMQPA